jgi:hypothetical protein
MFGLISELEIVGRGPGKKTTKGCTEYFTGMPKVDDSIR